MLKTFSTFLLLVLVFTSCDPSKKGTKKRNRRAKIVESSVKNFTINFIQKGKKKKLEHREVKLKKAPFTIEVDVDHLPGVFVVADFKLDEKYLRDNEFDNLQSVAPKTMAEANFNEQKELIINSHGYSYWFYNPSMDWHRYNSVQTKGESGFIGTKEINRFYLKEKEDIIPIKEAPDDLYLFFFSMEGSFEMGHRVLKREYIKVTWE